MRRRLAIDLGSALEPASGTVKWPGSAGSPAGWGVDPVRRSVRCGGRYSTYTKVPLWGSSDGSTMQYHMPLCLAQRSVDGSDFNSQGCHAPPSLR